MRVEFKLNRTLRQAVAGAAVVLLGCLLPATSGEPPPASFGRFVVQLENYPPPNETQAKILLEGEKAEPLPGGLILVTGGKLSTFGTNGAVISVVETPQYIIDTAQRVVTSPAPLRISISTASGDISLEGHGFALNTNSVLLISNRVHTVIRNRAGRQFLKR